MSSGFGDFDFQRCIEEHGRLPKQNTPPATPNSHKRSRSDDVSGTGTHLDEELSSHSYPAHLEIDDNVNETSITTPNTGDPQYNFGSRHNQHRPSAVTQALLHMEDTWNLPQDEYSVSKALIIPEPNHDNLSDSEEQHDNSTTTLSSEVPTNNEHHDHESDQVFAHLMRPPTELSLHHTTDAPSMATTNDAYQSQDQDCYDAYPQLFLDNSYKYSSG